MATPCNPNLDKAPFQTYRDETTGEWKVQKIASQTNFTSCKVIPFHRPNSDDSQKKKRSCQ